MLIIMAKVLVVEDSEFTSLAIKLVLETAGIEVERLNTGTNVMDRARMNHYDLVILDLMMPGISGRDVFHELKKDPATKNIPIIIITARYDIVMWDKELQASKVIKKPFDNHYLLDQVKSTITYHA